MISRLIKRTLMKLVMYRLTRLLCGHSPPISLHRLRSYHASRLTSSLLPQHHHSTPSLTTNVLLTNLSSKVIENDLVEALKEMKIQRVKLQPGISIHLLSEQDVELTASVLESKFNFKVVVGLTAVIAYHLSIQLLR